MTSIRTERLLLRPWREEDREPFAEMNADPEVMEHFPAPLTRDESDALIDRHQAKLAAEEPGVYAVEVVETGAFIGFIGLSVPAFDADFTPCVEVGWRLARAAWGFGYATEGARAALRHGFDDLGLDEIVSFTYVGNSRSRRVMERIGMTETTTFEHPNLRPGHRLSPHVLYSARPPQ